MADAPAAGAAPKIPGSERVVNPTTVLLLGLFTCGIYPLYWMWLRVKEMNDYLATNTEVRQCMVRFMSYFAYGAAGWNDDGCTLNAITAEADKANWTIRSVLTAITHAPHFTTRVQ